MRSTREDELREMIEVGEDSIRRLRERADEIEPDVRRLRGELRAMAIEQEVADFRTQLQSL